MSVQTALVISKLSYSVVYTQQSACFSFRQLLSNYDKTLVKTNVNNNITIPFKDLNFQLRSHCCFSLCWFCSQGWIQPLNTRMSAPSPKITPPTATPIHIPTNTQLRLISSHKYLTSPSAPHPAPLANHFKGRCYLPEKKPTEANPSWDPNCSSLTRQTAL